MQYIFLPAMLVLAAALPAAEYSTYIGDENTWHISKLKIDASGNTYVAGSRSFNLSLDPANPDVLSEAIVAKLDSNGKVVLFAALGGKANDVATDVAVDAAGNIYLAGTTTSPNFPVRNALYPTRPLVQFGASGFVAKLSPDASQVIYSTYFPAAVDAIAVDASGAAYVTGTAYASDFPLTPGLPAGRPGGLGPILYGAYLTKISPAGDRIAYSTVILGMEKNCGAGSTCFTSSRGANGVAVAVDAAGNAYLAGNSNVSDLPTTPGVLHPTGQGPFVAKVNAAGTALAYLTYLGTGAISFTPSLTPASTVNALAVDAAGNAYVAGTTIDPHLPVTTGIFHGWAEIDPFKPQPPPDAFALKLNPTATAVVWGRYLGGDGGDTATAATVDTAGNFWVAGTTRSTEFPNVDGWSTGEDFIVEFSSSGALPYSARYPTHTLAPTLAVDAAGLLRAASPDGVVHAIAASSHPLMRPWIIGPVNGHIAPGQVISIYGPHLNGGVFVNDVAAPILYSSDQQINAVVPFEIAGQSRARIRVGSSPEFVAAALPALPQIFAPALNQDGSINSESNPARAGTIMSVWVAGFGVPIPMIPTGQIATGAQELEIGQLYSATGPVTMVYHGTAPGLVAGIGQINFLAPQDAAVWLRVGNATSASLPIFVKP